MYDNYIDLIRDKYDQLSFIKNPKTGAYTIIDTKIGMIVGRLELDDETE